MKKGKLIVFEGVSGTGKETQAKLLAQYLHTKGIRTKIVFHPSPELKLILSQWRKDRAIGSMTETYLLLADRTSVVQQVIKPALARGEWVISLRNVISALVYQGKTTTDRKWITREFSRFEPKAHMVLYFDITPKAAMARVMARHARTGEPIGHFETPTLLAAKRNAYLTVMKTLSHQRIDAAGTITEIASHIRNRIQPLI